MRTCRALFKKAREDRRDPLLAWRNTSSEYIGTSPVQRPMGRRTRTLLPTTEELLRPDIPLNTGEKLTSLNKSQTTQYNQRDTKILNELHVSDNIRMRLPGDRRWSLGQCRRVMGHRSHEVEVNGAGYRRNRRRLRSTAELPKMDTAVDGIEPYTIMTKLCKITRWPKQLSAQPPRVTRHTTTTRADTTTPNWRRTRTT